MPSELLNALPYLPKLDSLGLQNLEEARRVKSNRDLLMGSLEPLLRCHALRRLDVSHTRVDHWLVNSCTWSFAKFESKRICCTHGRMPVDTRH